MKSVINLIRTPLGFSLLDGDTELNKSANKNTKEKPYSIPKKFAQQNFTIYPYIPNKESDNHKYILIPAKTQWFNSNAVHQIQKKALPQWFKIKKGILATMNNIKFEKHEDLYKKYRNYIIELGKAQYITPSRARKGLAGDACAIIRIHNFLEKWGLINYIHKKHNSASQTKAVNEKQPENMQLSKKKQCFDKDKMIISRSYGKDDLQLLKKITRKFRSVCHFCEGVTGVVWYEYNQTFHIKELSDIQGKSSKVIKQMPETSNFVLVICASCFYEGCIPVVLNSTDFKKKSIIDNLEQQHNLDSDKKKSNQQNKIADAIEKNKFRIAKTAQQLKMTVEHVFTVLMTMPIQKLQKISRIEPQTDTEKQPCQNVEDHRKECNGKSESHQELKPFGKQGFQQKIKKEIALLEAQQRQIYQKFLQSWLSKINLKLERLGEWENGVQAKYNSIMRLQKNMIARKVQSLSRNI